MNFEKVKKIRSVLMMGGSPVLYVLWHAWSLHVQQYYMFLQIKRHTHTSKSA